MATFFNATVSMRAYFSSYHLWAAEHSARLAAEIEAKHTSDTPTFSIELNAHVVHAVQGSCAFLDAAINEVYEDCFAGHTSYVNPLAAEIREALARHWKRGHGATLGKYNDALDRAGKTAFKKKQQPYVDAHLMIKLRNRLVHAVPEARHGGEVDELEAKLMQRFHPSRLMANAGNPYWPNKCLGAGCAQWSINSVRAFADEFFRRLGMNPNYQQATFDMPP